MENVALVVAWAVAGLNAAAAIVGGILWWQVRPSRMFWPLVRIGQASAIAQAAVAAVLYAGVGDFEPGNGLYWLYALLPVAVGVVAEGVRIASAEEVRETRGLPDAQAVGALDEAGQRSVVVAILRREMGVLALGAAVIAFLALRAVVEI